MAGYLFNRGALQLLDGTIDFDGADVIKARLSLTSETPNKDADVMTGLGLSATDLTLGSKAGPTLDDTNDRVTFTCGNPTFTAVTAGAEVNKMVVFKFITNDAASIPIAVVEITPITPNGGDIIVTISGSGLFYTQE